LCSPGNQQDWRAVKDFILELSREAHSTFRICLTVENEKIYLFLRIYVLAKSRACRYFHDFMSWQI
jgi:hypothetical protein